MRSSTLRIAGEGGKDFSGFPGPRSSPCGPKTRRPPAARLHSPPRHGPEPCGRQGAQLAPAVQIPHLQRVVRRAAETARRPSAVTATASDRTEWPFRVRRAASAVHVPHLQRLVLRTGDRQLARPPSPPRHGHIPEWPCRVRSSRPLSSSHTFSVLSTDAETARRPSPLIATPVTQPCGPSGCAARARCPRPTLSASCPSEAETARRPSPLNATPLTPARWPCRVRSSRPLSTSHTFSVLSQDAETASRPSSLIATPLTPARVALQGAHLAPALHIPHLQRLVQQTRRPPAARPRSSPRPGPQPVWPSRVRSSRPLSTSHTFSVWSSDAETARRPSRLTATPRTDTSVALEGTQLAPALHIPHLQRVVPRRGDRPPPVPAHRHATDDTVWPFRVRSSHPLSTSHTFSVLSPRRRDRPPPVPTHRHRQ